MKEIFNVYCSNWLYGFGRFIAITTSHQDSEGKDITSEAFVFLLDCTPQVKRFKAREINYTADPETHTEEINLITMEQEAQRQARNLIYEYQYEEYTKNKDINYMGTIELARCSRDILISLKIGCGYEAELKSIADDTKSEELREYISRLIRLPKLVIRDKKIIV
jgi:hypothetical protein